MQKMCAYFCHSSRATLTQHNALHEGFVSLLSITHSNRDVDDDDDVEYGRPGSFSSG